LKVKSCEFLLRKNSSENSPPANRTRKTSLDIFRYLTYFKKYIVFLKYTKLAA